MNSISGSRDTVTVRSPEGVDLELPLAGPASRVAAYSIDLLFLGGLLVVGIVLAALSSAALAPFRELFETWAQEVGSPSYERSYRAAAYLLVICMVVIYFGELLYFSAFELATRGRTPGKYLMRLRVVGAEGQPVSARGVLLRNVLRAVDILPASYSFGLIAMVLSPRNQRLGDHAAGTLVIRTDRLQRPAPFVFPEGLRPLSLSRDQLARLGEPELALLRATLRRVDPVTGKADPKLAAQVAQTLTRRLRLEPQDSTDPVRLLQELLVTAAPHELERPAH